jgi:hypothetical protein
VPADFNRNPPHRKSLDLSGPRLDGANRKWLLGALLVVLVFWAGGGLIKKALLEPVAERQGEIETLNERIAAKTRQLKESRNAARRLADWSRRSLPPDPVVASSLYQNWLIDLASRMKLTNVVVTPNRTEARPKGDTYYAISATIKAQGTLERLCEFLYEFRRSGLLHRVWRINLATDEHQGNPTLNIELTVEGLALKGALVRTSLTDPALAERSADHQPADEREVYGLLVKKNPFVRGYNGPPTSPDALRAGGGREFVYLVSLVSTGGRSGGMLYDRLTGNSIELTEGSEFRVAGVEGRVLSLDIDFARFQIREAVWRMQLGDNLAQLTELPSSDSR